MSELLTLTPMNHTHQADWGWGGGYEGDNFHRLFIPAFSKWRPRLQVEYNRTTCNSMTRPEKIAFTKSVTHNSPLTPTPHPLNPPLSNKIARQTDVSTLGFAFDTRNKSDVAIASKKTVIINRKNGAEEYNIVVVFFYPRRWDDGWKIMIDSAETCESLAMKGYVTKTNKKKGL